MAYLWPGHPAVNFFINPSTGDDNNSGRTSSAPKRTYAACRALALLVAITIPVVFNAAAGTTLSERIQADIKGSSFNRYGAGANPIYFGGLELINSVAWTNASSGRWTKQIPTPTDHTTIQTLSYNGALPTNKQASQAAVTADGQWFSANVSGVTTITIWSLNVDPNVAFTSITIDYNYGFSIEADFVSLYHVNSQRGYMGIHAQNVVDFRAYDLEVGYTGQHGVSMFDGCYSWAIWDYNVYRTGVGPTQGCHGLSVGGTGSIFGGGGNVFNITVQFAGEDCVQIQSESLGTVVSIWKATLFNGYENNIDCKKGLIFFYGVSGDQRGSFTTANPVLIHNEAAALCETFIYDGVFWSKDQGASNLQGGCSVNDSAIGHFIRCNVTCIDAYGIQTSATAGNGTTITACQVVKKGVGSIVYAIYFQAGTGHLVTQTTVAADAAATGITCLRVNTVASVTTKNNIWGTGSTSATRYCIDNQGTTVSANDNFWKGETTAVCQSVSTKKTAAQCTAGFTTAGLTVGTALVADPKFTDQANGDLRPQSTSPCKGKGSTSGGVYLDLQAIAFLVPPDIGALKAA